MQLLRVLSQASVTKLDVAKLPFDHSEWVFNLCPNLGFDLLEMLLQGCYRLMCIQGFTLAALHGDMPLEFALR